MSYGEVTATSGGGISKRTFFDGSFILFLILILLVFGIGFWGRC